MAHLRYSRRDRRHCLLVVALACTAAAATSCGHDTTAPSSDKSTGAPAPVLAVIRGSTSAYIDDQGSAPLTFYSDASTGPVETHAWQLVDASGAVQASSSSATFSPRAPAPGSYTVRLHVASSEGASHDTTMAVEILPELPRGADVPLLFTRYPGGHTGQTTQIFAVRPGAGASRLLMEGDFPGVFDWAPDGRRLVGTVYNPNGTTEVTVVDTMTWALDTLTHTPNGIVLSARWNPQGGSIAYTDDYRTPPNVRDELLVLQETADGWRQLFPGGASLPPNPDFYATNQSWAPDGTRVAASSRGNGSDRRVWIYENVLGQATRRRLTSDASIRAFTQSLYPQMTLPDTLYWDEGANDAQWSPDEKWVAFSLQVGLANVNQLFLVKANVEDGSIRLIARSYGRFTWSPDGNWIYMNPVTIFGADSLNATSLYRVHSGGGDLQLFLTDAYSPSWW